MFDNLLWTLVWALAVSLVGAVPATTILLHRTETHRALKLHPVVNWLFRCVLWITTGIYRKKWVALHRKHHAHTDLELDPHSPIQRGLWRIQWGNLYYYIKASREGGLVQKYASGGKDDWSDRLLFNNGLFGLALGITALCLLLGWKRGFLVAGLHAFLYVVVISGSINGLCHVKGYKNFPGVPGTNIRLLTWLTGGESLHNNHHAYQRSPKFSYRRSEFDPSWVIIWSLVSSGLATRQKTIEESLTASVK